MLKIVVCCSSVYLRSSHTIFAPVLAHIFAYFISHLNTGFQSTFSKNGSEAYDITALYPPTNNF
jgi:hypothetical protein